MQNGKQLGTDLPPSLAKKKKVRLQKKLPKAKPISAKKKTAEPEQGYTKHVTDTHKKVASHQVSNRKVEYLEQ